jgi:hypothetical protein
VRLWSLHPRYLDARGLVALWREGLLAQRALAGATVGYRSHPQLVRFKRQPDPLAAISAYLKHVQEEAVRRGYRFDATKIAALPQADKLTVTDGQLKYELELLKSKLRMRDVEAYRAVDGIAEPEPHPLFRVVPGQIESWEIVSR